MRPVKVLHCADFHFDTPFRELPGSKAEIRKEDLRETFGRVVNLAKQETADIMLICGDLFDNQRVNPMTIDYLINKLRQIPEVRVFISPGNHDPYNEKSYYSLVKWPPNTHIFKDVLEKVEIEDLHTCVYGRGFSGHHHLTSLLRGFSVEDPQKLNIMALHGDVVQSGQISDYNPITIGDIKASGLDYLALGHRHSYQGTAKAGATYWAYCGCPEGRGFDEPGDRGVLFGEAGKGICNVTYHEICKRKYLELKIDIESCYTYEEITERIRDKAQSMEPAKNLFKIKLQGEIPEDFVLYMSVISEKIAEEFFYHKMVDETSTRINSELLVESFTLRGLYAKKMIEKIRTTQNQEERRKAELALKYGLRLLQQGEAGIE